MSLVLNEEQQMLRDAAQGFLTSRAPLEHLRAVRDEGLEEGFSRELWQEIAEMGWAAILVPEQYGGLEYGYAGIGIVLEECGRTLTPSPLLSTAIAGVTALVRGGSDAQREATLPAVATGEHLLALAIDDGPGHQPRASTARARAADGGFVLDGDKYAVVDGQVADTLIVSATTGDDGEISLFLVPADATGVSSEPLAMLDIQRGARVVFDGVALGQDALLGTLHEGAALLDAILDATRIGQAAEMLGLAQEAFSRTLDYLRDRTQFGVPIGSFQALQHRAADMFSEIEVCKSAVRSALRALDDGRDGLAAIASMTKAKLCETAHRVAAESIQMHGGIGVTDEYDIGFFLKRCRILEAVHGDRYFHLDRFARERGY
jgi:alkylation response protein AidB-like acyl-CoA dehydrogenase